MVQTARPKGQVVFYFKVQYIETHMAYVSKILPNNICSIEQLS